MLKNNYKNYPFVILFFCFYLSFSQTNVKQLKKKLTAVTDIESAKQFIKENPDLKTKIYTYNEEKHNNSLSKQLFGKSEGSTLEIEEQSATTLYKIISISPTLHYRASYIYLDGKKLNKIAIDSLHKVIMTKIKKGHEFNQLAGNYSMDRNSIKGGDLGWFTEDKVSPEFLNSLKKNKPYTVYDLDIVDAKKHYIINKTHKQKDIRLLQVLKITFEREKKKRLINVFN